MRVVVVDGPVAARQELSRPALLPLAWATAEQPQLPAPSGPSVFVARGRGMHSLVLLKKTLNVNTVPVCPGNHIVCPSTNLW
jgi:hypothetical protein